MRAVLRLLRAAGRLLATVGRMLLGYLAASLVMGNGVMIGLMAVAAWIGPHEFSVGEMGETFLDAPFLMVMGLLSMALEFGLYTMMFGAPFALPVMVVVRLVGLRGWPTYMAIGILVAAAALFYWSRLESSLLGPPEIAMIFVPVGALAGLVYWSIARPPSRRAAV